MAPCGPSCRVRSGRQLTTIDEASIADRQSLTHSKAQQQSDIVGQELLHDRFLFKLALDYPTRTKRPRSRGVPGKVMWRPLSNGMRLAQGDEALVLGREPGQFIALARH